MNLLTHVFVLTAVPLLAVSAQLSSLPRCRVPSILLGSTRVQLLLAPLQGLSGYLNFGTFQLRKSVYTIPTGFAEGASNSCRASGDYGCRSRSASPQATEITALNLANLHGAKPTLDACSYLLEEELIPSHEMSPSPTQALNHQHSCLLACQGHGGKSQPHRGLSAAPWASPPRRAGSRHSCLQLSCSAIRFNSPSSLVEPAFSYTRSLIFAFMYPLF